MAAAGENDGRSWKETDILAWTNLATLTASLKEKCSVGANMRGQGAKPCSCRCSTREHAMPGVMGRIPRASALSVRALLCSTFCTRLTNEGKRAG
jgi:hypothetical protein